jgi:hypothetical protein
LAFQLHKDAEDAKWLGRRVDLSPGRRALGLHKNPVEVEKRK